MDHPAALSSARWEAAARPSGPGPTSAEGAGGSGGHGRASRSTTPSAARVWRSRGRPGPKAPGTPAEHTKYRPMGGRRGAFRAWSHWCGGRRRRGLWCPWVAAGPGRTTRRHQAPPDGRLPQPRRCEGRRRTGLRCPWVAAGPGRASRRRAEPKARGADGERAGRRPRAHKAARRANCLYSPPTPGSGRPVKLTKRAMSPWKRAVTVAVAPARCLATMMSASPGRSSLS